MQPITSIESLEQLPIQIDYVAEVPSKWETALTTVDQWRVTISSKNGFHSFDYFTGIGLRNRTYSGFGKKWDAMRKKHYDDKPKKPLIADVLSCLISDANAENENFNDWCDNLGYSNDSIKAMKTYKECLDVAIALRKHFPHETLSLVRELLENY